MALPTPTPASCCFERCGEGETGRGVEGDVLIVKLELADLEVKYVEVNVEGAEGGDVGVGDGDVSGRVIGVVAIVVNIVKNEVEKLPGSLETVTSVVMVVGIVKVVPPEVELIQVVSIVEESPGTEMV
jgi:hypothetical protein